MANSYETASYELLVHALIWSGRALHAELTSRLHSCTAAQVALGVATGEQKKVLDGVQQNSTYALIATVQQLQQLHQCVVAHHGYHTIAAETNGSAATDTLATDDFCSPQAYQAWLCQSWKTVQQQLWQLQQLPAYRGELQLHMQGAVIDTPEQQPTGCFSCLCSTGPANQQNSPYCVVWLKDNTLKMQHSSNNSTSSLPPSHPLGLLTFPGAATASNPAVAANAAPASLTAGCGGTQTQRTGVVESCNQPQWQNTLQYHVGSQDAVLRLQVRSSTSTGATLEWFRSSLTASGVIRQGTSTHGRVANISDPFVGQVSLPISSLQQAMQEQQKQLQQQGDSASFSSMDDPTQLYLDISVPLYGAAPGVTTANHDSAQKLGANGLKGKSRRTGEASVDAGAEQQQMALPDFMADALQQQQKQQKQQIDFNVTDDGSTALAASNSAAMGKKPLTAVHKASETLVMYDPCTGSSSGIQGRKVVGEVQLRASYKLEQQLQPDSSACLAAAAAESVQRLTLLTAVAEHAGSIPLPQPLCKAAATAASTANSLGPAFAAAVPAGGRAAAELDIAGQLVAAIWQLWQCGALADAAAAFEAALIGSSDPQACATPLGNAVGHSTAAAAAVISSKAQPWAGADVLPRSSDGSSPDWTLPAVRTLASYGSNELGNPGLPRHSCVSRLSYDGSTIGAREDFAYSCMAGKGTEIGRRATVSSAIASSRCSYSVGGSDTSDASEGGASQGLARPLQLSKLQYSSTAAVTGSFLYEQQHWQYPAWFEVLQVQQQCLRQMLFKQDRQQAAVAAEGVLQQLSLQTLIHASTGLQLQQSEAADSSQSSDILPGAYYLQLLSDAAVIGGLRPAAVRLALLKHLLQSWQPDAAHLQVILKLSNPLLLADRQQLLTKAESAAFAELAGKLLDVVQQLLSCHYDLYSTQAQAGVCLPLLLALLAALSACTTQQQLVAAATPLLAAAAQLRLLQVLDPEATTCATAAIKARIKTQFAGGAAALNHSAAGEVAADVILIQEPSITADVGSIINLQADNSNLTSAAPAVEHTGPVGIFDMLKFRDFRPRLSNSSGTTADMQVAGPAAAAISTGRSADADLQATGSMEQREASASGLFGSLLDMAHQARRNSASDGVSAPNIGLFSRLAGQQQEVHQGTSSAYACSSNAALPFWRRGQLPVAKLPEQLTGQQHRSAPGPIAEGILRCDSDEALEAACGALEAANSTSGEAMGLVAPANADKLSAPGAGKQAASSRITAGWGSVLGGKASKQGPLCGGASIKAPQEVPLATSVQSTGRKVALSNADDSCRSSASAVPVMVEGSASLQDNLIIRTKLVYDSTDRSAGSSSSITPTANRRNTVQNVGYFGVGAASFAKGNSNSSASPGIADSSGFNSGSSIHPHTDKPCASSRHARTGSLGRIESTLSNRFCRQQPTSTAGSTGTLLSASSLDTEAIRPGTVQANLGTGAPVNSISSEVEDGTKKSSAAAPVGFLDRRVSSQHGRSGSLGSLQLWESHKQAHELQQKQSKQGTGSAVNSCSDCSPAFTSSSTSQSQPMSRAAVPAIEQATAKDTTARSCRETASHSRPRDADWERDAMNVATALGVLLEELANDVELQVGLPPQLQLPLIGLHVRYYLIHNRIKTLFACGHELPYDATVRQLEAGIRQLHKDLVEQGWAQPAEPTGGNYATAAPRQAATGALPDRDAAGNLPPVVLCDLDSLMAPIWETWLRNSAQQITSVVDGLVAVQSGATGLCSSCVDSYSSRSTCWVPVAADQGALYSSSVVDLFFHLQGLTDQVIELAVKPVRNFSRRTANVRLLSGVVAAAIERYTAHLHAAAAGLLSMSQVVVAPNICVQSGKMTRHRRGESVGSPAGSRQGSITAPTGKHGRTHSALPSLLKPEPSMSAAPAAGSSNSASSSTTAAAGLLRSSSFGHSAATVSSGSGAAAGSAAALQSFTAAAWMPPTYGGKVVLTAKLCVVLNSLQEVLHQQHQLDQRIWEELLAGGVVNAEAAAGVVDSSGGCGSRAEDCMVDVKLPATSAQTSCNIVKPVCQAAQMEPRQHLKRSNALNGNDATDSCSDRGSDSVSDVSEVIVIEHEGDECAAPGDDHVAAASTDTGAFGQRPEQLSAHEPTQHTAAVAASSLPEEDARLYSCTAAKRLQSVSCPVQTWAVDIQHSSRELSGKISTLITELVQAITEQLQLHHTVLLASVLCVCGPAVEAAVEAVTCDTGDAAPAQNDSVAVQAATAAAAELLAHDASVQLLLEPVIAELRALKMQCSSSVTLKLLRGHWRAVLGATVQLALCQAHSTMLSKGYSLPLPCPLGPPYVILLQQLLGLLQTEVCQAVADQGISSGKEEHAKTAMLHDLAKHSTSSRAEVLMAVADVADAAARTRAVLKLLLLPTPQAIQQFLDMQATASLPLSSISAVGASSNSSSRSSASTHEQLSQVDVLRCLRQRAHDPEAQLFVQMQLRKAGGDLMRLLFPLPVEEKVQVYAACSTVAGLAAPGGGLFSSPAGKLVGLRGTLSNSSSSAAASACGCLYLSLNYLAFTDLISNGHTTEDDEAFAKRIGKVAQQQEGRRPASKLRLLHSNATVGGSPAAAGPTGGSSASSDISNNGSLATRSWWKTSLLASSSSSSSNLSRASGGSASSSAAAGVAVAGAADTTILIPLASVARFDKVYCKDKDALALTMLDRSSRLFYGFESTAVRDKLHDAVRLAVMGSNTALDRNLRCFEETVAALDLGLPPTEKVLRMHQCLKYGAVRNKPGNLYLCSTLLAFDYDDTEAPKAVQGVSSGTANTTVSGMTGQQSPAAAGDTGVPAASRFGSGVLAEQNGVLLAVGSRIVIRYQDILHVKQDKGTWSDKHWLVIMFTGPNGEAFKLELGGGAQASVSDIMADLSRIVAAVGS